MRNSSATVASAVLFIVGTSLVSCGRDTDDEVSNDLETTTLRLKVDNPLVKSVLITGTGPKLSTFGCRTSFAQCIETRGTVEHKWDVGGLCVGSWIISGKLFSEESCNPEGASLTCQITSPALEAGINKVDMVCPIP